MSTPTVTGYGYNAGWAIVGSAAVVVGLSLAISLVHWRNIAAMRRRDHARPAGLRAWHVATISVVFAGYAAMIAVGVLEMLGVGALIPRDVRFVIYASLNVLAIVSLIIVARVVVQRAVTRLRGRSKPASPSPPGS